MTPLDGDNVVPLDVACESCGRVVAIPDAYASHCDGDRVWTCEDCLEPIPLRPGWRRDRNGREWYSVRWLNTFAAFAAFALAAVVAFLAPARATAASPPPIAAAAVAAAIVGHPVSIVCDSGEEWATFTAQYGAGWGATFFQGDTPVYAVLSPYVCTELVLAASDTSRARARLLRARVNGVAQREGVAIATLAWESEHLAGIHSDYDPRMCAAVSELQTIADAFHMYPPSARAAIAAARRDLATDAGEIACS